MMSPPPLVDSTTAQTVLGIIDARERDDVDAAAELMRGHIDDMVERGMSSERAWIMLATSAVVLAHGIVCDSAAEEGITFDEMMREIRLAVVEAG